MVSLEVQQQVLIFSRDKTCRAIATELGLHRTTVERILRKFGIQLKKGPRPVPCDDHFFGTYSAESCYWGGMLLADGYIRYDRPVVDLHLKAGDVGHVRKFAAALKFEGRVHEWERDCRVTITSSPMVNDLRTRFGVVPQKTPIAEFPTQVPQAFWSHLVRGIFDGDGCITYPKGSVPCISFVGTLAVVTGVREAVSRYTGVTLEPTITPCGGDAFKCIEYSSVWYSGDNAKRVCDWMYEGATFESRLDRKHTLYVQHLQSRGIKRLGNYRQRTGTCVVCHEAFTRATFNAPLERTTCGSRTCRGEVRKWKRVRTN